jgi:hypothetical protein
MIDHHLAIHLLGLHLSVDLRKGRAGEVLREGSDLGRQGHGRAGTFRSAKSTTYCWT